MNCSIEYLSNLTSIMDKCNYIKHNCPSEYINTYSLYYCTFKGHLIFSIPFFIFIIFILFLLLSSTGDIFLGTSITKVVEIYNINHDLAALTLIAFGNGAPDVISSIVAPDDSEGVEFCLGNAIGAALFVTTFGIAVVVYFSKEIEIDPKLFTRDIILYIVSLVFLIFIGLNKKIHFIESLGFIIIYCVNIFLAIFQAKFNKKDKKIYSNFEKLMEQIEKDEGNMGLMDYKKFSDIEQKLIDEEKNFEKRKEIKDIKKSVDNSNYKQIEVELEAKQYNNEFYKDINDGDANTDKTNDNTFDSIEINSNNVNKEDNKEKNINKEEIKEENNIDIKDISDSEINISNVDIDKRQSQCSAFIFHNFMHIKLNFKKKFFRYKEKDWDKISKIQILFYLLIDYPLLFLREITIPLADENNWNKYRFCIMPITSFLFICISLNCKSIL